MKTRLGYAVFIFLTLASSALAFADFTPYGYSGYSGNGTLGIYGGGNYNYRSRYGAPSSGSPLLSLEMDEKKIQNSDFRVAAREERLADVKRLLKEGADVNSQSESGETALMYASRQCATETARVLLEARAKVNLRDLMGRNALIYAVMGSCEPVVQLLLKEPELSLQGVDEERRSALDYSEEASYTEVDGPSVEILRLLKREQARREVAKRPRSTPGFSAPSAADPRS